MIDTSHRDHNPLFYRGDGPTRYLRGWVPLLIDHLWRRGDVRSLTPPARGGTARPKRSGATGCCTFHPPSTLLLGSWVSVLGSVLGLLGPFSGPTPENQKPQHRQKCSFCPARLPGGYLGCLVAFPFPCGPVAIPFPSHGAAASKAHGKAAILPWVLRHMFFSVYGTSGNREMPRICVLTANPPRWSSRQHSMAVAVFWGCPRCGNARGVRGLSARRKRPSAVLSSDDACWKETRALS